MEEQSFEELLAGIDAILQKLEHEDLQLEQSMKMFEEGMASFRQARAKLEAARIRLELVTGVDPEGNVTSAPLDIGVDDAG